MSWVGLLCVIMAFPTSYSLAFCVVALFYGEIVGVFSSLAINLLRKNKLVVSIW